MDEALAVCMAHNYWIGYKSEGFLMLDFRRIKHYGLT
jgi:hypothetical protein